MNVSSQRKHALAGHGPIVNSARRALRHVASQFGQVTAVNDTLVHVRTVDGIDLTLSYNPGNYVFSRVYNLTVSALLPKGSPVPAGIKVSFRGSTPHLINASNSRMSPDLTNLNTAVATELAGIDLHSAKIERIGSKKRITVVPLGGSYVWVLIPPVFKATTFPQGEPGRIIKLIRSFQHWSSTSPSVSTPPAQTSPMNKGYLQ